MAAVRSLSPPQIRGPALRRALIAGARRVIAQREQLDRINVFPVPDGDTGSNLAFTLGGVLAGALSRRTRDAGELLRRVGEDAVDGARGNSGAILAQFFTGVAEAAGGTRTLDIPALARAIRAGAASARQALSEPREGTILSVIAAFAEALDTRGGDFREWFGRALEHSRRALANTPNQLPVLARAGVVDAGAQGFVDLLEGIGDFIATGRVDVSGSVGEDAAADVAADLEAAQAHGEAADADPAHRWCSECLLVGDGLDRAALRAAVGELGASCVVIAGGRTRLRLHAHVADPAALFATAARFGRVEGTKADDMSAQARTAAGSVGVAVITDSAADLPAEAMQRLNIHMVAARVNFGDEDHLDKVGLSTAEFYRKLRTEIALPRTSQPPPGDFRRQFEFLLSHHRDVVYVGLSRNVSGTLQSAETAAQRGHPGRTRCAAAASRRGRGRSWNGWVSRRWRSSSPTAGSGWRAACSASATCRNASPRISRAASIAAPRGGWSWATATPPPTAKRCSRHCAGACTCTKAGWWRPAPPSARMPDPARWSSRCSRRPPREADRPAVGRVRSRRIGPCPPPSRSSRCSSPPICSAR